jgi:hypothetical protein
MSGGSLTSWGGTSSRFSVQGKCTHSRSRYCSIICSGSHIYCSGGDWPFKLIVSVEHPKNEYRYTPRSDFSVFIDKLACLLVEFQSEKDQSDRNRMLLQAACAARLGRQMYNNTFIVVALYIETSGRVIRYFIFQRDDADLTVRSSESKQSCVFSLILLGFLCQERLLLEGTVPFVCLYVRNLQPGIDHTK